MASPPRIPWLSRTIPWRLRCACEIGQADHATLCAPTGPTYGDLLAGAATRILARFLTLPGTICSAIEITCVDRAEALILMASGALLPSATAPRLAHLLLWR